MCGIVACRLTGGAEEFLLPALRRLEYRGYDSAGIAVTGPGQGGPHTVRAVGRLDALLGRLSARPLPTGLGIGVGHTRWATHGVVSEANAHPHRDCSGSVAVVHNGILDNADQLRAELTRRGHRFSSEVDSEVVAHLVEEAGAGRLVDAVRTAVRQLHGSWALAVTSGRAAEVVLACHRSPLVVGLAEDGYVAASDLTALLGTVGHVHVLQDGDIVELTDKISWTDGHGAALPPRPPVTVDWAAEDAETGVYEDFMEKEIAEQPAAARRLLERLLPQIVDGRLWAGLGLPPVPAVRFVACGSSLHASAAAARVFRRVAGLPTTVAVASEFEPEPGFPDHGLTVAVSQSGETADVLSAVEAVPGPLLAITNSPSSSLARRADAVLDCTAGPEIGVAATKTFTTQVIGGAALGLAVAAAFGRASPAAVTAHVAALARLPDLLDAAQLTSFPVADALADDLADAPGFFFVSRGAGLPYAAEGALKLKEITYRWAEGIAAGELKHGPIALIDESTPVVVVDSGSRTRLNGAAAEMRARGARIIRVGAEPEATFPVLAADEPPWGPLESVVALQHLARSLAITLGRDTDKPRNLAKSVTVL